MTYRIGVVAHIKRQAMAEQLADQVRADYVGVDDGALGAEKNHLHVWKWLTDNSDGADHLVVLEDDAVPCDDFRTQLDQALAVAPSPVVSFYLGTSRPVWIELAGRGSAQRVQPLIKAAVVAADTAGASFITAPKLFHAVAVAIRTDLIPAMVEATAGSRDPIDAAIGRWCDSEGHTVSYTYPSLVDHLDQATVIRRHLDGEPRTMPRKAYRVGTRGTWTTKTVDMTELTH